MKVLYVFWGTKYKANCVLKITQLMGKVTSAVFLHIFLPLKEQISFEIIVRDFMFVVEIVCNKSGIWIELLGI
jgi:hypothetical protein